MGNSMYINISLYHTKYDWSTHQLIHIDMTILINLRNLISLPRHEKNWNESSTSKE